MNPRQPMMPSIWCTSLLTLQDICGAHLNGDSDINPYRLFISLVCAFGNATGEIKILLLAGLYCIHVEFCLLTLFYFIYQFQTRAPLTALQAGFFCGLDWDDAITNCKMRCPSGEVCVMFSYLLQRY
jgi:hypothetical protein